MISLRKMVVMILGAALLTLTACNEKTSEATDHKDEIHEEPLEQVQEEEQKEEEQVHEEQPIDQGEPTEGMPPTSLEAATTVMRILKNGDMSNLAAWAHPDKGIRFSPYAYVDQEKDLVFLREELEVLMENSTVYEWRTFPGSGDLIELTYADYHKKFVYDADFFKDAKISLNEVQGESTTTNNLNKVYPKATYDFVEYYIDGIDPSFEGMDWRSLRLVFEKIEHDHILVGIIHDQWTP
ncbi:hypothetical protein [Paenisporosarcina indica]|uniref:hypothetical protein n=1 Tax=Paenisporosarcina indica TaxID=650093 RepID=UPI0009501885|nr:hypothetical protein [Paenisporosarcina indica]